MQNATTWKVVGHFKIPSKFCSVKLQFNILCHCIQSAGESYWPSFTFKSIFKFTIPI